MIKDNNLVSIITPLYNKEKLIEETIKSVLSQTYTDWEMIIVDDCSSDASAEIVKQYSEKDSRIRYYKNEQNLGAAMSRNKAMELSNGRYIAFLDADDLWKVHKLEKQIGFMQENNVAFCYSACDVIDEHGSSTGKSRYVPAEVDYHLILKGNPIPCLTVVLDKTVFPDIKMKQMGHEDYVLWLDLLKYIKCANSINEILASYREYGNSLSSNKIKAAKWQWKIYREYVQLSFVKSCYYFANYFVNGLKKRL